MKKYVFVVLITLAAMTVDSCQTSVNDTKFNLEFENVSNPNGLPDGWIRWGMSSFNIQLDSVVKRSGRYALRIEPKEEATAQDFACPAYSIPAIYEGKSITLKAFLKFENAEKPIGLLLRIDGNSGSLQFDNMMHRGVMGTQDWTEYSVTLPLQAEAKTIFIGAMLSGTKGVLWMDDFQVLIDNEDIAKAKLKHVKVFPAENDNEFAAGSAVIFPPLDEQLITNLNLLGKLWGFLKYHHPEVGKGNYNWDYELFRVLPEYLKVQNNTERDKVLLGWINKYGKIPACTSCKETPADAYLKPDLSWVEKSTMNDDLKKKIREIYLNRHQGDNYYIKIDPDAGNPDFLNENPYNNMPFPDAGFRLLALYRYWNMIHYFFPSTYLTDNNWGDVLKEYVPKFISAQNRLEYELATIQIIGEINITLTGQIRNVSE